MIAEHHLKFKEYEKSQKNQGIKGYKNFSSTLLSHIDFFRDRKDKVGGGGVKNIALFIFGHDFLDVRFSF